MIIIGDRWPDTLATHRPPHLKAVRPVASRLRLRSSNARRSRPPRKTQRNGMSRRGETLAAFACVARFVHRNGPGTPTAPGPLVLELPAGDGQGGQAGPAEVLVLTNELGR